MRHVTLLIMVSLMWLSAHSRAAEQWIFRFGFETPRKDSQFIAAANFAKLVKDRSGGKMVIKLFPDSVLGTGPAMLDAVRAGKLDMYMGGSGYFANLAGKLNILDLPFIFRDYDHADAVLTGKVGAEMLAELEPHGIKGLAFFENGFRCLTNSKHPVKQAADIPGLKMRILDNPIHSATWNKLGASTVPLPLTELYPILETRTLDAQDHPVGVTFSARLYEVQRYVTLTNHVYSPLILAMSDSVFNSLPDSMQRILLDCAAEASTIQKQSIRTSRDRELATMERSGCIITQSSDVDVPSFKTALGSTLLDLYLKEYGGPLGLQWLTAIELEGGGR